MSLEPELWQIEIDNRIDTVPIDTLKEWAASGYIKPTTKVTKGNLRWIEAQRVPALRNIFPVQSVPASNSINSISCINHQERAPLFICAGCQSTYCYDCVKHIGTNRSAICQKCDQFCEPYKEVASSPISKPQRVKIHSPSVINDLLISLLYPFKRIVAFFFISALCGLFFFTIQPDLSPSRTSDAILIGVKVGWPMILSLMIMLGFMIAVVTDVADASKEPKSFFNLTTLREELPGQMLLTLGMLIVLLTPLSALLFVAKKVLGLTALENIILILGGCWLLFYYPVALIMAGSTESFTEVVNPVVGLQTIKQMGSAFTTFFVIYLPLFLLGLIATWIIIAGIMPAMLYKFQALLSVPGVNFFMAFAIYAIVWAPISFTNMVISSLLGHLINKTAEQ